MNIHKKRVLIMAVLSLFVLLWAPLPGSNAEAGTQSFVVPNETVVPPINLDNGSFQTPVIAGGSDYGFFAQSDVVGWDIIPANTGGPNAYALELQRAGTGNGFAGEQADGDQYCELNVSVPGRIYQTVTTTPGTRVLWGFAHRARAVYGWNRESQSYQYITAGKDAMKFYLRPAGTPTAAPSAAQTIKSASDDASAWVWYNGIYTVPAGQTGTEIAFGSISTAYGDSGGNYVDAVRFQTPAKLVAKKAITTSAPDNAFAFQGETVTVTVTVTNWGETDASRCVFKDVLSDNLDYISGSAMINGVAANNLAFYKDSSDELRINFGNGATGGSGAVNGGVLMGSRSMAAAGSAGKGETMTISFQAKVTGDEGAMVKNQSSVSYDHKGYESWNNGDTCYSSVEGKAVSTGDETTYVNRFTIKNSVVTGKVWYDSDYDGIPDSGESPVRNLTVGLYQSGDTTYAAPCNDLNNNALTAVTATDGSYRFAMVPGGTYKVMITTPEGYLATLTTASTDNLGVAEGTKTVINNIAVSGAGTVARQDIGLALNRTVKGRVWYDDDRDGVLDPGESPAVGLTLGLYPRGDTAYTAPVKDIYGTALTAVVAADGSYSLGGIPAGSYKVAATVPDGYEVTLKTAYGDNDAVAEGSRAVTNALDLTCATSLKNVDIGFAGSCYALQILKNDSNAAPLTGAGFQLYADVSCAAVANVYLDSAKTIAAATAPAASLRTDGQGLLSFYGLVPGTYYLKEIYAPTGYALLNGVIAVTVHCDRSVTLTNGGNTYTPTVDKGVIKLTISDLKTQLSIPQTGYPGVYAYLGGGLGLMILAAGAALAGKKRRPC